jgi:hypothetical protein
MQAGVGKKKLRQSRPRGKNIHSLLRAKAHDSLYESINILKLNADC